jgi:hypothetical protein
MKLGRVLVETHIVMKKVNSNEKGLVIKAGPFFYEFLTYINIFRKWKKLYTIENRTQTRVYQRKGRDTYDQSIVYYSTSPR